METKPSTWKDFFEAHPEFTSANKNLEAITDLTKFGKRPEFKMMSLVKEKDLCILSIAPNHDVQLFHHLELLGGTRLHPDLLYVGLSGSGPSATPIEFSHARAFSDITVKVPDWNTLRSYSLQGADQFKSTKIATDIDADAEDEILVDEAGNEVPQPILDGVVPSSKCITFQSSNVIAIPPALATVFMEASTKDPAAIARSSGYCNSHVEKDAVH